MRNFNTAGKLKRNNRMSAAVKPLLFDWHEEIASALISVRGKSGGAIYNPFASLWRFSKQKHLLTSPDVRGLLGELRRHQGKVFSHLDPEVGFGDAAVVGVDGVDTSHLPGYQPEIKTVSITDHDDVGRSTGDGHTELTLCTSIKFRTKLACGILLLLLLLKNNILSW